MPVIQVEQLHKRYGDRVAVEDVSFAVEAGEIFGILGPNGAGKTTTVELVEGLSTGLDPQARRVTWALIERIRDRGVTVVLVTHLMDEAERLSDRVALLDRGRVVAVDTPAGLAERAGADGLDDAFVALTGAVVA